MAHFQGLDETQLESVCAKVQGKYCRIYRSLLASMARELSRKYEALRERADLTTQRAAFGALINEVVQSFRTEVRANHDDLRTANAAYRSALGHLFGRRGNQAKRTRQKLADALA